MVEQIAPCTHAPKTRSYASQLRAEVSARALTLARVGIDECTRASVVFAPGQSREGKHSHGNFIDASYKAILANPAWSRRLTKAHTAKRQARATGEHEEVRAWCELDAATSSDALLMNIVCYPRLLRSKPLRTLLGISAEAAIECGYHPQTPRLRGLIDRTEIDLRIGNLLIEAKLTEADFQTAPLRLVERYTDFDTVFDRDQLAVTARGVQSYQLIRGVLAAYAEDARFCVLSDARRPDLIEAWYAVIKAVRSLELQARLQIVTWQEIADCTPTPLQQFLADKYGIVPASR